MEIWIVGSEAVMGRYVPRVVGCVSRIGGMEVANRRSGPGERGLEVAMPTWELTIWRNDGRILI